MSKSLSLLFFFLIWQSFLSTWSTLVIVIKPRSICHINPWSLLKWDFRWSLYLSLALCVDHLLDFRRPCEELMNISDVLKSVSENQSWAASQSVCADRSSTSRRQWFDFLWQSLKSLTATCKPSETTPYQPCLSWGAPWPLAVKIINNLLI